MQRDPLIGKIPISLITGFLGSGKTTLIARLLRHPAMDKVAIIINEVGEIGIDHDLVAMSSESVSLLANGCLCCTVRTDLQDTLRELFGDRRAGRIPDFDRVMIETTGLADPVPVLQTLTSDTMLSAQYRIDGVVTLVDAVNALSQLDSYPQAEKQIAHADRIFITKADLSNAEDMATLRLVIKSINSMADVKTCAMGDLHPSELTGLGLVSARAGENTLRFLGEHSLKAPDVAATAYLGERLPTRHDPAVNTVALRFKQPFTWAAFSAAMETVISLRGKDLLRVKGIVNVDGQPTVVQGAGHVFHPPLALDKWPSDDTDSRLVFITRNMQAGTIYALFEAVGALRQHT